MEPITYEQRGYLNDNFRLFHLRDNEHQKIAYHYHTFHKVVFLLAGRAGYCVEGERFQLTPGDFVLVGRGSVHRPDVESGDFYERVILYIDPAFLRTISTEEDNLEDCFLKSREERRYVFHASKRIQAILHELEKIRDDSRFGTNLYQHAIFVGLLVELNRTYLQEEIVSATFRDQKIISMLQYINSHLSESLSIDELSERFYFSKYHMMRRFKEETGYSIHQYMQEKRLLYAQELVQTGLPLSQIAEACGYQDYSTFSRAYKAHFGSAPRKNNGTQNT